jgi:flagellar biosynthesis protein FliQ
MKSIIQSSGVQSDTIRAGVISSLIMAIGYLWVTGISDLPRAIAFMVSVAVCFVLMMKSVVDLLVWIFGLVARYCGFGLGRSFRFSRSLWFRFRHTS